VAGARGTRLERTIRYGRAVAVACAFIAMIGNSPALAGGPSNPTIVYVDDDAKPGGDGSSWNVAFRYLQDALAVTDTGAEVRIAQGTYRADQGEGYTIGDPIASFTFYNGLALRGGYAGLTGPDPDQRDFELYPTVLSGALYDGQGTLLARTDSIVVAIAVVQPLVLEGLVIRDASGGVAFPSFYNDAGAGLFAQACKLEISDCIFEDCRAMRGAGAALLSCSDTIIRRCKFLGNNAYRLGGGVMIGGVWDDATVTISDCLFQDQNIGGSFFSDQRCGGIYVGVASNDPDPIIERCEFINNTALDMNGAAGTNGGINASPKGIYIDCNFIGNDAEHVGGVSANMLINCYLFGNSGLFGVGGAAATTSINSIFEFNSATHWGAGGLWALGDVINCEFKHNWTYMDNDGGGAVMVRNPAHLINCLFNENAAVPSYSEPAYGHAVAVHPLGGDATLTNCTFVNNGLDGSGVTLFGAGAVRNCILWNNDSSPISGEWQVLHSCVQGGWDGEGNITVDPIFVAGNGPDGLPATDDDDFRLSAGSPCLDAGDTGSMPSDAWDVDADRVMDEPVALDLDMRVRFAQQAQIADTGMPSAGLPPVDMGCYERPALGDLTGDGWVNVDDLLQLLSSWGICHSNECPADLAPPGAGNGGSGGDGQVDVDDFLMLLLNWS
jgi:hypothetical protein